MIKVSVIVPVRDAEKSLFRCVSSLVEQTMGQMEILLVDAASQDGSRELMEEYRSQFPELIRCLSVEGDLAEARNAGLLAATGEYVAFVEATDYVEPDLCELLYLAAGDADMCGADYWSQDSLVAVNYGEGWDMTPERKAVFIAGSGLYFGRIYKRSFLERNDLKFPENNAFSDHYFNFMTALLAKTCVKAPGKFYHAFPGQFKGNVYDRLEIPSRIICDCHVRGIYADNKDLVDYKYIAMQMGNVRNVCLRPLFCPDRSKLAQIAGAVRAECPDYAKGKYYKRTMWQMRLYLGLTMKSPLLACLVRKFDFAVELIATVREKMGME